MIPCLRSHQKQKPRELADTPPEGKDKTLGVTMGDVKVKPLVNALPNTLQSANADANFTTLCHVRAESVAYTIAKTLH